MPTIRIRQHRFYIRRSWPEGHVLTLGEAQALTQLAMENIRNNVDEWVVGRDRQQGTGQLGWEEHQGLEQKINQYADGYEFKSRRGGGAEGTGGSHFDRMLRRVAEERAGSRLQLGGVSPTQREIEAEQENPECRAEAERRLVVEQRVAQRALEELL